MNKRAFDSFFAFRMSTATWAGSAFRPVLSPSVNRAVRYSFTFSENLTLPLGLLTAHPVRRDEWGEVSTGEVSGVLESMRSWVQIPYRPEVFFFRPYFHYCLSSAHYCEDHFLSRLITSVHT